jgi:hypothetical protein
MPELEPESQQTIIEQPNNESAPHVTTHDSLTEGLPNSSDWPTHVVNANRYLTEVVDNNVSKARDWGNAWLECVREFIEFQKQFDFPDTGLSFLSATKTRPPKISIWMKNRHPWKDVDVVDTGLFRQQWWAWWLLLHPDSWKPNDEPTTDMDWVKVQKPGKNGFLLIMLALVWWGAASSRDGEWLRAVADVKGVLCCMCEALQQPARCGPLSGSGAANVAHPVSSKHNRKRETSDVSGRA